MTNAVVTTALKTIANQPEAVRFRLNGFYQRGSVGVAVRVISDRIPQPDELGLPPVKRLVPVAEDPVHHPGDAGSQTSFLHILNSPYMKPIPIRIPIFVVLKCDHGFRE